jgi:hypothetical protein
MLQTERQQEIADHCLGWYPPAPCEGPPSIVGLPPDDWVMEAKLDGCRVVVWNGRVYTRHGTLLSPAKGAAQVLDALRPLGNGVMVEGEWAAKEGTLTCLICRLIQAPTTSATAILPCLGPRLAGMVGQFLSALSPARPLTSPRSTTYGGRTVKEWS